MLPKQRDYAHLWDMRQAAREIVSFLDGVTATRFKREKICATPWNAS